MLFDWAMSAKFYSTGEAAKKVGITRATLQAWIANGKITPPAAQDLGKIRVRLWSESAVAQLRRDKHRLYKKEMGRPSKNGKK